jgi:hypothetical protein
MRHAYRRLTHIGFNAGFSLASAIGLSFVSVALDKFDYNP